MVQNTFARSAAFDKIKNVFSLTYSQMIVQHFRQLNVHCFHLYFMKTGHELNCCVFISCECINLSCHHAIALDGHMSRRTLVRRENTCANNI